MEATPCRIGNNIIICISTQKDSQNVFMLFSPCTCIKQGCIVELIAKLHKKLATKSHANNKEWKQHLAELEIVLSFA